MKRPLAYITAAGVSSDHENTKLAVQYAAYYGSDHDRDR